MKVIHVGGLAGPNAEAGGVWAVARAQAKALRDAGHEVTLMGAWLGNPPRSHSQDGVLFRFRRPFPGAGLRGLISLRFLIAFARQARSADVIHIHLCRDFMTTTAALVARALRKRVVAQPHGMYGPPKSRGARFFDLLVGGRTLKVPQAWFILSNEETVELIRRGVRRDRMHPIANAVPLPEGTRWSPPNIAHFCFISRLAKRKQPEVFTEAAIRLLETGIRATFSLAGPDQGSEAAVRELISRSGYVEEIHLRGPLDRIEVERELSSATAMVLPARDEVYPMIVLEASAIGTPTVLTTQSAISEMLAAEGGALVVEPTVNEVAAAMATLSANPQLAMDLSRRARQIYEREWTLDVMTATLIRVYEH